MSELQKIIKSKYDNDWIALSNEDKIFQLTNLVSSQKNHYGFKPQGLWLGKGDSWLQYVKENDITNKLTEYCSAFSIKLGSNILELKDKEDYVNFTKRYSETPMKIKWEVVAKKYDGIIAYAPRRFAFDNTLSWTYGWDITSACIWNDNGIENVDLIFNGCNDENFETFRGGGKIHYSCVLINQKEVLGKFGQVHENLYSHHSTIEYKPTDIKGLEVGKPIDLKITGRLKNDNVDVLLVDNPYSKNKYPHITLSTAEGVKPVSSNFEIENNLEDVIPLDGVLKGVITVCRFEQGGEIEDFKKGGQLDNPKLKEWVQKLNNFGDGCLWVGKDSFADDFLNSLFNIVYLLNNIDTNFTIDTNPNNFAYNTDPDGDKVICLFDIEDVQDNGGQFDFTENTYPKQTFFDNPENDENYKLIEKGIGSLGAVYQDKRDGTILKLTASAYEVYGTSKVMIAQQENEEDSSYNIYFPTIYSIQNAGVKEYRGRDKIYYAIRRKDIEPFRHESLRNSMSGKEVLKTYTIRCVLEAISEYYRIVEPTKGYAGEVLMKVNISKPIKILREVLQSPNSFLFKKGGNVVTWKHKYNKKYGYPKNESHSLKEIAKDTGVSMKGIRQIYNKGIGAYKTNPSSVRPNVTSKEQWAYARVYSSVMGGKASKVDAKELKMETGGLIKGSELIQKVSNYGSREGSDMIEFANENINPQFDYVLTEIKISELINNDKDLAYFVDGVIDNPTMYSDVTEYENPNTHLMPILINEEGLVTDGYGRISNSVYKGLNKVFAYVPNHLNKYKQGGYIPYKYRSRFRVPNVRGGWTENKIIRHLKEIQSSPSFNTYSLSNFISTVFPTVEDFKKNIYYHGTANPINGLKPSITFSERQAERMGGGGYGERYWGISLTKRKKTAESFSGQSSSVAIYPVILKPDAKVIIREDLQDASEIEDIIVDLWNQEVDAVWIGGGEEELIVINPYAIVVYKQPEYHQVFGGFKSVQPTDEEIEQTFNEAKEISKKTKEKLDNASEIEDRQERIDAKNEITRSLKKLKFKEGGKASKVDAKELKMEKGGKLFDKRKKELQIIAEGEKTIRNSKRGYDKYLTILKDLKNGLKKDKEINLIGVYLKIQDDIRRYNDLVELYTPIVDKDNRTTAYIDNLIRVNEPNLKIYPYTIDELEDVYYKVRGYKAGLKNSFKQGGEVCTYDFDGYDLAKMKCGNDVDVYLIPAEYDRVSIFLFENHFPLWLYYNYLSRIVISKEDVFTFKKQCLEKFEITNPVQLLVKPSNDKYWKTSPFGEPRSYMGYSSNKGVIGKLEIVLVRDGFWEGVFKERTSGLTLPNPKGVQLNTVIHEFAHLIDVIRYNEKNPNKEIIVTHQRGFIVALTDILIASKRKEIPIVSQVDNKALIIQKALQKPSFIEKYKDTYGLNVFDGTVPKDLKEYDERFAYLKGSKLNKEQAKEIFDLLKKYQDEVLMDMAMRNPNKANRLYKQTNQLLENLKKYS